MNNILRNALAVIALLSASSSMKAQVETWTSPKDINVNVTTTDYTLWVGLYPYHMTQTFSRSSDLELNGRSKVSYTLTNKTAFATHTRVGYIIRLKVLDSSNNVLADKYYGFRQTGSADNQGQFYRLTQQTSGRTTYYLYNKDEIVTGQFITDYMEVPNGKSGCRIETESILAFKSGNPAYTSYSGNRGTDEVDFNCDYVRTGGTEQHGGALSNIQSCYVASYDIYDDKPLWYVDGENTDSYAADDIRSNRMDVVDHSASVSSDGIKVTVHRKLVPNSWTTLCLPFDFKVSDIKQLGTNVSISKFDNVNLEKDVVNFYTTTDATLKAGKPYLFWYDGEARVSFDVTGVTFNHTASKEVNNLSTRKSTKKTKVSESDTDESLMYYYAALLEPTAANASSESISGDACMAYIASPGADGKQHVKKLSATGSIKGFRAYLYYPATASSNAAKGTDCISIDDMLDGGATGIPTIAVDGTPVSNAIYNLNGQYVGTDANLLPRGIYVRGGKKFCK